MLRTEVQNVALDSKVPASQQLSVWARAAYDEVAHREAELTIRIVDEEEGTILNDKYRKRPGATNVLSFPFQDPPGLTTDVLGDVVICAPVVMREAQAQHKLCDAHWAHMVVHGVLHLCGYDHQDDQQAETMETLEAKILSRLGYPGALS